METALATGKQAVCGWEANGGFLTGSNININGRTLTALPTRDAILPILAILSIARRDNLPLIDIFSRLPKRFSRAALIKQFPRASGLNIVKRFSPADESVKTVVFNEMTASMFIDANDQNIPGDPEQADAMNAVKTQLETVFSAAVGFEPIYRMNFVDGVRMYFSNGDVAHLRPSGNADELRIYAVADTQARADQIAASAVAEPDGLLRKLAGIAA
jgi:phosphomannomutase